MTPIKHRRGVGRPRDAEIEAQIRAMVALCDQKPRTSNELMQLLGARTMQIKHWLHSCSVQERLVWHSEPGLRAWMTPKLHAHLFPHDPKGAEIRQRQIDAVRIAQSPEWLLPTPTVEIVDGVRITRANAPASRYAPTIAPGSGAISEDWFARRQGVQLPTRLPYLLRTENHSQAGNGG